MGGDRARVSSSGGFSNCVVESAEEERGEVGEYSVVCVHCTPAGGSSSKRKEEATVASPNLGEDVAKGGGVVVEGCKSGMLVLFSFRVGEGVRFCMVMVDSPVGGGFGFGNEGTKEGRGGRKGG